MRRVGPPQERPHHQSERLDVADEDEGGRVAPRGGHAALLGLRGRPHAGHSDVGPQAGIIAHQDPRGSPGKYLNLSSLLNTKINGGVK